MSSAPQDNSSNGRGAHDNLQHQILQQLLVLFQSLGGQNVAPTTIQDILASGQGQMQNINLQQHRHQQPQQPQQPRITSAELLAFLSQSGNLGNFAAGAGTNSTNGAAVDFFRQQQQQASAVTPSLAAFNVETSNFANTNNLMPAPSLSSGSICEIRAGLQRQPATMSKGCMANDTSKDESRETLGSVVVPCRARGMPMDHNFKTAYFVIPENVLHGEELMCSYFACRNAGVKFRYCSHCKVPVAKRNFHKRHKHGHKSSGKDTGEDDDEVSGTEEDNCSDEGESKDVPFQGGAPASMSTGLTGKSCQNSSHQVIPSQVTTMTMNSNKKGSSLPRKKKSTSSNSRKAKSTGAVCARSEDDRSKEIENRQELWASLLEKRPQTQDGEAMSSWLMQVLVVSDLWKPLNESENLPKASLDLIRERAQGASEKKMMTSDGTSTVTDTTAARPKSGSSTNEDPGDNDDTSGMNTFQESNNHDRKGDGYNSSNDSDTKRKLPDKRPFMEIKSTDKDPQKKAESKSDDPPSSKMVKEPPCSKQKLEES